MQFKTTHFFLLFMIGTFTQLTAQDDSTPNFWQTSSDALFRTNVYEREIVPEKYETYHFDPQAAQEYLAEGLSAYRAGDRNNFVPFHLPTPNGKTELYYVRKDNLVPAELNAKFPEISVYAGYAVSDPNKTIRMDFTDKGFRAVCYAPDHGTFFIDPIAKGVKNTVMSYYKKDYKQKQDFECLVEDAISKEELEELHLHAPQRAVGDCELHTFELALACTGEYAAFHGGTVNSVMAEFVTSINRINGLFETELGVVFEFVPNNDQLIFLNATTDPYTNNNGGAMLGENQQTCDQIIGSNNYDIGHVYSTGGGGIARLFAPCSNTGKAQGVTGLPNPVGDPFYVDFVAHEIGHQFGGTHSYNNSCQGQRSNSAAFEPGSGSTIMAYAGICVPNVQFQSDAYFHTGSLIQIANFLSNVNCQDKVANGTDRPVIAPLQDYTIPMLTPFELAAEATVTDGSVLTYCWEQTDIEIAPMPPEANATEGPSFRSLFPTVSPSRYFPALPFLTANVDNIWEVLPGNARDLNFRVTVRSASPGQAGCKEDADLELTVSNTAGPFLVTSPNNNATWTVGETQTVTWQVANTNTAPVNCSMVNILLSFDGGFTYPLTLVENTPNDGSVDIQVPNTIGTENRIRVQSVGNVFFDISNTNFSIVEPMVPTFSLSASPAEQSVCGSNAGVVSYEINSTGLSGFSEPVELSTSGLPNGVQASFSNNNTVPNTSTTLDLEGVENLSSGNYSFTVEGQGGGQNFTLGLEINVVGNNPAAAQLISPANISNNISTSEELSWQAVDLTETYSLEISDDINFNNIVYAVTVDTPETIPEGLLEGTVYYWRVRGTNICGEGQFSDTFRFRTGVEACTTYLNDIPVAISATGTPMITSSIAVFNPAAIESMTVSTAIQHTYVSDLDVDLVSPSGDRVTLFDRPGIPATNFGCSGNNILAAFDDEATLTAEDFESTCDFGVPFAIEGTYQPIDPLATFTGDNPEGNWTLELMDNFAEDGGELIAWQIEICNTADPIAPPTTANNSPLTVEESSTESISNQELLFTGIGAPTDLVFTLISLPSSGTLSINGQAAQVGSNFTQEDINNNQLTYTHNGDDATSDSFVFDTEETDAGWAPNNTFQINIIEMNFSAMAQQTETISCFAESNGAITITLDGGNAPFMYSLDGINFQASNVFNNLSAGDYTVTIRDNDNNETTSNTVSLSEPTEISVMPVVDQDMVTINANGGTGTLTYSLDNTSYQNENVFSNLPNGTYTFYVRDDNGCMVSSTSITILVNDLSINANISSDLSCFNGNDATITVNISGGNAPFSYSLNEGASQSSNVFTGLGAGDYIIVAEDANGFTISTNTISIQNPSELVLTTDVLANQITVNGSGGTGSYQYSIDGVNFQNENIFSNLVNGDYTLYIRDANNCLTTEMVSINIDSLTTTAYLLDNILCAGDATASVMVNASGGTAPYEYGLNNNFQSNNVFANLAAGNYNFVVRDVNGMQATANISVSEPVALSLQVDTNQDQATLNVQGGTAPYQYSVDNGTLQSSLQFSNLAAGNHSAMVIDVNNCSLSTNFTITISPIEAEIVETSSILCAGDNNGSIRVNASGGIMPYTFSIDGNNFQSENTFENLSANNYTIIVRDVNNLETQLSYTLSEPMPLSLDAAITNDMVVINALGGTPPYEYNIDGGNFQTANQFFNLPSGDYTFEVRDANNCSNTIDANINFIKLSGEANLVQSISCAGAEDGSIEAVAIGGNAPYSYSLDGINFQNAALFSNLASGVYSIVIRDNDGIEFSTNTIVLNNPTAILATIDQDEREVEINASGGTGMLGYSLDGITFQSNNVFSNLVNGDYTVYIQDSRMCAVTLDFTISVNDIVGITSISQEISCHDANDGIIAVESSGGTAPREFSIDGGITYQASNFFTDLAPGEYEVTIRDADGLIAIANNTVQLSNPERIEVEVQLVGDNVNVLASGGTGTLLYSLNGMDFTPNNIFTNLPNGPYTVYVRDANDCEVTQNFSLEFTELSASVSLAGENLCAGDELVSITITGSGGTPPYAYRINNGNFTTENVFSNLGAGIYTLSIQDAIGAIRELPDVEIEEPAVLFLSSDVDGDKVSLIAQGGTSPYSYSLNGIDFQDSEIFMDLDNDDYTALVRDNNGCTASADFTINVIPPLSVEIEVRDILYCNNPVTGSILATGMGGVAPYQYSLDNGPFRSSGLFVDVTPGAHNLTIMDDNSISVTTQVELVAPSPLEIDITINDNDVEIDVVGGTAPYTYSIDGGQTFTNDNIFADLEVGDYEVIVEDGNGCTVTQMISIISTSTIQLDQSLIFELYPNPAQGRTSLTLNSNTAQDVQISLADILGRTVRVFDTNLSNGTQYDLDINDVVSGTYLIRVDMNGLTAIKKLIVQ